MPRRRPRHNHESKCRKKMSSQGPGYGAEGKLRRPPQCVTNNRAETVQRTTWRTVEADANARTRTVENGVFHHVMLLPRDLLYDLKIHDAAC